MKGLSRSDKLIILVVVLLATIVVTEIITGVSAHVIELTLVEVGLAGVVSLAGIMTLRREVRLREQSESNLTQSLKSLSSLNERLQSALDTKNNVLRMVTHDLKNPLWVIASWSDLLSASKDLPQEQRVIASRIQSSAKSTLQLIEDLMDSSLISKKVELQCKKVRLESLVRNVADGFVRAAERKHQQIDLRFHSNDGLWIYGDSQRLEQVFSNLISNAIKYSPIGGRIRVDARSGEDSVDVVVSDCGPGLESGEVERVFDVFTPVRKPTTGGETSHGLGLSIVRSLVELHGGEVGVQSPGRYKGTDFKVHLPTGKKPEIRAAGR